MIEILIYPEKLSQLTSCLDDSLCCAVVGLSNTGKSTLLRSLMLPEHRPQFLSDETAILIHVDCNRMLELTEQGFYETILRAARSRLRDLRLTSLAESTDEAYQQVVHPANEFAIALGFMEGIESLCEQADRRVVLLLDEFDDPFAALEGRTFLNLRALRDRYGARVVYVVAAERPLDDIRDDEETAEFRELFAGHTCALGMQPLPQAAEWVRAFAEEEGVSLGEEETAFVIEQAGGHPGLLRAVTRLVLRARSVAPETYARMGTKLVAEALAADEITRRECERLWTQLEPDEQSALQAVAVGEPAGEASLRRLSRLGLIDENGEFFAQALAGFARRWTKRWGDFPPGVWIDEDAGEVYVNGQRAPTLTDLEYRLLSVLFERQNKLCDKYLLVEQVWGEEFLDEVDDARVEKLVSRLRAKIEEDPANPHYVLTVRGRGYRLRGSGRKATH